MVKNLTRRDFLKILLLSTGSAAIAVFIGRQRVVSILRAPANNLYDWITDPELPISSTGSLSEQVIQILLATTEALVDMPVEPKHYEDYFRWRAENLSGYKELYESFALNLNNFSKLASSYEFLDTDKATQQKVLTEMCSWETKISNSKSTNTNNFRSRIDDIGDGIFERNCLLFEKYILDGIIELFDATDAWVVLGYQSWPGIPQGLDSYTQPIIDIR